LPLNWRLQFNRYRLPPRNWQPTFCGLYNPFWIPVNWLMTWT
jgi:hypothetical protein